MTKIIEFPTREAQGMAFLEKGIKELMHERGETEEAAQLAVETLKQVFKSYGDLGQKNFEVRLPKSLNEEEVNDIQKEINRGIQLLNEGHARMINRLASELVLTKLKLLTLEEVLKQAPHPEGT